MKKSMLLGIGILLLCASPFFAQGYTLTSEDIILLKQTDFSEEQEGKAE